MRKTNDIFEKRLAKHMDELRWLYMELYDNEAMFAELCEQMQNYYRARNAKLRKRDLEKEKDQAWYRKKNMLGMMLYIDNFAGNLRGVKGKLKYLEECGVNCVHLMPFLDSPKGRSDGGYAVADLWQRCCFGWQRLCRRGARTPNLRPVRPTGNPPRAASSACWRRLWGCGGTRAKGWPG